MQQQKPSKSLMNYSSDYSYRPLPSNNTHRWSGFLLRWFYLRTRRNLAVRQQKMWILDWWQNVGRNHSCIGSFVYKQLRSVFRKFVPTGWSSNWHLYLAQYHLCSQYCCRNHDSPIYAMVTRDFRRFWFYFQSSCWWNHRKIKINQAKYILHSRTKWQRITGHQQWWSVVFF